MQCSAMSASSRPVLLGYRFNPTDLELVTHFLAKKIAKEYVSPSLIPICDNMYTTDPRNLPIDKFIKYGLRNEAYYFVLRQNIGTRGKRQTVVGTWKAGGIDKPITDGRGIEVGHVLQLSYHYEGAKQSSGWIMHEYRLGSRLQHKKLAQKTNQEWVVCRIKRPSGINKHADRVVGDFDGVLISSSSIFEVGNSSSSSSAITMGHGHDLGVVAPSPWQAVDHNDDQDIRMGAEAQAKEETAAAAAAAAAVTAGGPCTSIVIHEGETCSPKTVLPSISYMDLQLEPLFTEQVPSSRDYYIVPQITAAGDQSFDGKDDDEPAASNGARVLLPPPVDRALPPNIIIHPYESWDTPKLEFVEEEKEEVGFFNTPHLYFLYAPPKSTLGS